jgi:transposase
VIGINRNDCSGSIGTGARNQSVRAAIATRYDKLARNFLAAVQLVAAIILLN